jgi:ectoine hydroxylase-related dioxygenase (phytanoyl-CoA dioxygenase family)
MFWRMSTLTEATEARTLDAGQLAQFAEQGYLVFPAVFDAAEVARMRGEADRILELVINSSLTLDRTSRRLDLTQDDAGNQMVRKIQPINDLSLYLSEVSADERLLGPMRQLMGDEPVLMEEKLNYKEPLPEPLPGLRPARADSRFPVHSDWAYYKAQNYPQTIISSAVSMDDCTPESGPLRVWPGSHRAHLEHERLANGDLQVRADLIDLHGGQDILAPAGSVMLFHVLLVHNSRGNGSGRPRRLMIYSHFPEAAGIGFDVRNGRTRFLESPFEWEFAARVLRGEAAASFQAPRF